MFSRPAPLTKPELTTAIGIRRYYSRRIFTLMLLALLALLPKLSLAQEGTLTDDAYYPQPTKGYNVKVLTVDGGTSTVAYIRFRLSTSLPPGTPGDHVGKATLKLFVSNLTIPGSFRVHRVTASWKESDTTIAPNSYDPIPLTPTPIDVSKSDTFVTIDLTPLVRQWLGTDGQGTGGLPNYGIALVPVGSASVNFDSKEATQTSHMAQLEIVLNHALTADQAANADQATNADRATTASSATSVTGSVSGSQITGALTNATIDGGNVTGTVANASRAANADNATSATNAVTADSVKVPLNLSGTNNVVTITGNGGTPNLIVNSTETGGGAAIQAMNSSYGQAVIARNTGGGNAVYAQNTGGGTTIYAQSTGNGNAILAQANSGLHSAVEARNTAGYAVYGESTGGQPTIKGFSKASGGGAGVMGQSTDSKGIGVFGYNDAGGAAVFGRTFNGGNALEGLSSSFAGSGLYAKNDAGGLAGKFDGDVIVNGNLSVSGTSNLTAANANHATSADHANTADSATMVTNGVYTTGSYANPSWLTSLDGGKITGTVANATNAATAGTVSVPLALSGSSANPILSVTNTGAGAAISASGPINTSTQYNIGGDKVLSVASRVLTLQGLTSPQGTTGGYLSLGAGNFYYPGGSVTLSAGASSHFYGSAPGPYITLSGNDYYSGGDITIASGHSLGSTTGGVITLNAGGAYGSYPPPGHISLQIAGSEYLRIASDGRVGVGTATPGATLEVRTGGTTLADAWTTRSSARFKTNVHPIAAALYKVLQLRGVTFNWKDTRRPSVGFIAEEVAHVLPEAVEYEANGKDTKGLDYSKVTPLLVEAIKIQQHKIEELQQENARLQTRNAEQEARLTALEGMVKAVTQKVLPTPQR